MDGRMNGQTDECKDGPLNGRTSGWTDKQTIGRTNERTDVDGYFYLGIYILSKTHEPCLLPITDIIYPISF